MTGVQFLRTALRDHRIGAVTRTAPAVRRRVCAALPPSCMRVAEYGSGDGVVTADLLTHLHPEGRMLAIERNAEFLSELARLSDPRLQVLHGDVLAVASQLTAHLAGPLDAVVSNVPCTVLSPGARDTLIANTHAALRDGGVCIMYQYSLLMRSRLRKYFRQVDVVLEPRNFPPYFVMRAVK